MTTAGVLTVASSITAGGAVTGSNLNISNWNTAYGWGNHASAGYVTSSGNTIIGTYSDINTSGSTIIDNIYVTDGVITSMGTRTLTLANLGYTGATNANYITNNNQLTNGAGYVTTNTTYSVGDGGLTQKNFTTTLKSKLDGIATGATANNGTVTSITVNTA